MDLKPLFLRLYDFAWGAVTPLLRFSPRLREGYEERLLKCGPRNSVDVWVQAASVGEAFLALEIVSGFGPDDIPRMLITTNTSQGADILREGLDQIGEKRKASVETAYFPFDAPSLMQKALKTWRPALMVLLETEFWPGLMAACKMRKIPLLVLNGRLSQRSFKAYSRFRGSLRRLGPEGIYAISPVDGERFSSLFGEDRVKLMHNIKFDRMDFDSVGPAASDDLRRIIPERVPFLVLGSVRREEERDVLHMVEGVFSQVPRTIAALFPRHSSRIESWKRRLSGAGLNWALRSRVEGPVSPGSVLVWDTFGELSAAYGLAHAAFVGGSLRPCGGQNFLEAIAQGVRPCIGPYWENFSWVGREILNTGLVREVRDWRELVDALVEDIESPGKRNLILRRAGVYINRRKGGTETACRAIASFLRKTGNTHESPSLS